jgi:signal-transduction protein with cAMP-binding, CBS, and nucleotidyltransferase domain/PAS domain-containing protein
MRDLKANKFIYSIVVPTLLAISMFIVSFYVIIIPLFEQSMMDRKKETIQELTNTAWSVLAEYQEAYKNGSLTLEEAKKVAADQVGKMRYGKEQKDYFWITSTSPVMIMHPYRSDLNGKDMSNFADNHENKLFVDAAQLVREKGEGTLEYYWQWKDDASKIVLKLSYVKGFEAWNWVIGTGIYLEDVRLEIKNLKKSLLKVSFVIILLMLIIFFYILRQSKAIEDKRVKAEEQLRLSIQKYKSLVDASTEGTLMLVKGKVVFTNIKFISLLQDEDDALIGTDFSKLFRKSWDEMVTMIANPQKTYTFETELLNAKAGMENVVVSATQITQSGQIGYIIAVRNVTEHKRLRLDAQKISDDIQLSLQLMNQPVHNLINKNVTCSLSDSVSDAARIMTDNRSKLICVKEKDEIIGVVTDTDLRSRVLAKKVTADKAIYSVMTSPVKTINQDALLYEAVLLFEQKDITHLLVENNYGAIIGNISNKQCLEMQRNSLSYLIREINACFVISDLKRIYDKLPVLIQAIFTSTDNINSVSRTITSIADAINTRIIEMALKEVGEPPCEFAFVAMGSEGRGEQTLKADQDNAIIFEDHTEENKDYFLRLSEIVNENLHTIGYSRCKGDLMAGNPEWCNALNVWKDYFSNWINNPDVSNVLDSSIFFDLRLIYGNDRLVNQLFEHVYSTLDGNTTFFNQLAKSVIRKKPVIEKKVVNLKQFLLPIIGYLRIHALYHAILETNSLLRLNQLMALDVIPEKRGEEIEKSYNFLMHLRIKWQVDLLLDNDLPDNSVLLKNLTDIDKQSLKTIGIEISKLQDDLQRSFKVSEYQQ